MTCLESFAVMDNLFRFLSLFVCLFVCMFVCFFPSSCQAQVSMNLEKGFFCKNPAPLELFLKGLIEEMTVRISNKRCLYHVWSSH